MNADSGGTNEVHGHDAGHGQLDGGSSPLRPDTVSGNNSGHAQLPQAGEPSESGCQTVAGLEMVVPGVEGVLCLTTLSSKRFKPNPGFMGFRV